VRTRLKPLSGAAYEEAAGAFERRGELLYRRRRIAEAERHFDEALARGADPMNSAQSRWMCAMLRGDFAHAWTISDAVLRARGAARCTGLPHHLRWVWDGRPLTGKRVLVLCYHGLGDTLQFARFVPLLARTAKSVTIEAQSELLGLLRSLEGATALVPLDGIVPDYDVDIEVMELPHALRITLDTLPADVPYFRVPRDRLRRARHLVRPVGERFKIGLVWSAGGWKPERSVPFPLLAPLSALPGVALFNLQLGPARDVAVGSELAARFIRAFDDTPDILDTAALMAELDLVVTVDTMAAHLAGAFGRRVWTLLHFASDWRWMIERCDSPWYPTMRLFRQEAPEAWSGVMAKVVAALEIELSRLGTLPGTPSF